MVYRQCINKKIVVKMRPIPEQYGPQHTRIRSARPPSLHGVDVGRVPGVLPNIGPLCRRGLTLPRFGIGRVILLMAEPGLTKAECPS